MYIFSTFGKTYVDIEEISCMSLYCNCGKSGQTNLICFA